MLSPGHLSVNFLRTAASSTFSSIRANLDMRPVSQQAISLSHPKWSYVESCFSVSLKYLVLKSLQVDVLTDPLYWFQLKSKSISSDILKGFSPPSLEGITPVHTHSTVASLLSDAVPVSRREGEVGVGMPRLLVLQTEPAGVKPVGLREGLGVPEETI